MEGLYARKRKTLRYGDRLISWDRPMIMGVVNITPDSFYDGGLHRGTDEAVRHAVELWEQGAEILDIGGYSTRPGAAEVSVQEEMDRVLPVIEKLKQTLPDALLSVDTFRAAVAEAAVRCGAGIINDVSGGTLDPDMFATVGRLRVPYVLMHMRGTPQTMTQLTHYQHLFVEILQELAAQYAQLRAAGAYDIILDPGFGFAKTVDQNYALLAGLDRFNLLNLPILVGVSRKSMIYRKLGITPAEALNGTTALHAVALPHADILRVHDVAEAKQVVVLLSGSLS